MKSQSKEGVRSVTVSEARLLLDEQRDSGLSVAAFARSRGIRAWSLYNAQASERRRAQRKSKSRFAEVRVSNPRTIAGDAGAPIELALTSGLTVRVQRDFDEVALRRLLGVLASC